MTSESKLMDKSTTTEEREIFVKAIQVTLEKLDETSPQPTQEVKDMISEVVEENTISCLLLILKSLIKA